MKIVFYRGKGLVNSLVRWQTNSHWAHVGVELANGVYIDSTPKHGVKAWLARPAGGTGFSVDHLLTQEQRQAAGMFLYRQVGKKYDYQGVLRFLTREKGTCPNRWFCSELVFAAFQAAGENLLKCDEAWRISPGMLAMCPLLVKE